MLHYQILLLKIYPLSGWLVDTDAYSLRAKNPKAFVSVPSSFDPEKFRNHPLLNTSFKRFALPMALVSWQSLGVLYDKSDFLMPPSIDTICSRKLPSPSQKTLV